MNALKIGALFLVSCTAVPIGSAQTSFVVRNSRAGGDFLWSIAASPTGMVVVGDRGAILTSTTGTTWTRRNSGVTDWLVGVTYGAGKFIAVGDRGRILASVDGVQWTAQTATATSQRLNNVIFAAGQFVAVGEAGTIVTSPDGLTWRPQVSGFTGWLRGLAYTSFEYRPQVAVPTTTVARYFVCVGEGGEQLTSPDGIAWFKNRQPGVVGPPFGSADLESVVVTREGFVAVGQSGVVGLYAVFPRSLNGLLTNLDYSWRALSTGSSVRLRGLAQGADALFATGERGAILSAPQAGGPWTPLDSGTTANLVGGLYVGNSLYVIGENETILQSTPLYPSRLANISTRGQVGSGADIMISGLVVTGTTPKRLLVRAVGPALGAFGVPGALRAPVLTVLDGASRPLASNTGWSTGGDAARLATVADQVGGFPLATDSADSALLVSLAPGSYTFQVAGRDGTTGVALVEAYDADALSDGGARAVNISTRGVAGAGSDALIAGFNIAGAASRRVLIRAVGPTLGGFGVPGTLARPIIEVFRGATITTSTSGPWSAQTNADEIRGAALLTGAFALNEGSQDAAMVETLAPGSWTVRVTGANGASGVVLVEVYDLP